MYRYKKSVGGSYARQGYIYFASLRYRELPRRRQETIRRLCQECGGEYADALLEFVTTEHGAVAVCMAHHLSQSTLERAVRRYYQEFPGYL